MNPMDLATVARLTRGHLAERSDAGILAIGAAADSRAVTPGDLFVAIPGERADGHTYIGAAAELGAVAALSTRPSPDLPTVVVADPVAALGQLARGVLGDLHDLDVLAVTGSSGKTTTKDLLACLLAGRGPVVAPQGSFNTEVGLPLTALRCDSDTRSLVLEMGARGAGHVAYLCAIGRPRIGIVLNVGSAHVGEFGSRDAIAAAKQELPEALPADGVAVLSADDPLVRRMAPATDAEVLLFGYAGDADLRMSNVTLDDRLRVAFDLSFRGQQRHVALLVAGEHNAGNAVAAAGGALAAGMSFDDVCEELGSARVSSHWRMEVGRSSDGVTVINDAYNANPDSMAAALKALAEMGRRRGERTWAVLGEMRELGEESASAHDAIGRLAVRLNIGRLLVVGDGARPTHMGAAHEGSWAGESMWVPDIAAAEAVLAAQLVPGDIVLVKASRSIGFEAVAEAVLSRGAGDPP